MVTQSKQLESKGGHRQEKLCLPVKKTVKITEPDQSPYDIFSPVKKYLDIFNPFGAWLNIQQCVLLVVVVGSMFEFKRGGK